MGERVTERGSARAAGALLLLGGTGNAGEQGEWSTPSTGYRNQHRGAWKWGDKGNLRLPTQGRVRVRVSATLFTSAVTE